MKHYLRFTLLSFLLFAACQEDPAPTGVSLLPNSDLVDAVRFDSRESGAAVHTSTYYHGLNNEYSTKLWIGTAGSYEAVPHLRWYNFTYAIGNAGTIVEAKMILYPSDIDFGGSGGAVSFDVMEITKEWGLGVMNSSVLDSIETEPVPRGSYTGTDDSIVVQLDTAMVRTWMNRYTYNVDKDITNRGPEPLGIQIRPKGMTNIRAFSSVNAGANVPALMLVVRIDGELDTLYGASLRDTYFARFPDYSAQPLAVHGGLSNRGRLKFDISGIPTGSIVNYVRLILTRNHTNEQRNSLGLDSILVFEAYDDTKDTMATTGSLSFLGDNNDIMYAEGGTSKAAILLAVQKWVNNPGSNRGFILTKYDESSDFDQLIFYGSDAEPEKRPRIEIYYTTKP